MYYQNKAYIPSRSTFYTPTFPFIESRLNSNHTLTVWLHRSIRITWLLLTLPIHIISVLLFIYTTFPLPNFLISSTKRNLNHWNLIQSLFYPLITRLLWSIPGTGGSPPEATSIRSIPFSSKILSYFNSIKVEINQEDLILPKEFKLNEWIKGEAFDLNGLVIPKPVPCFWLQVKKNETIINEKNFNQSKDFNLEEEEEVKVKSMKAKVGERVILYLVGGGYIMGNPLIGSRCYDLARESGLKILAVNYRKALTAPNAYPAALQDVIISYAHLISLGYKDIICVGDSAGGGLCLTLQLYLSITLALSSNSPKELILPSGLLLYSPWVDLTLSSYKNLHSIETIDDSLNPTMMGVSQSLYLINLPTLFPIITSDHPFLSPSLPSSLSTLKLLLKSYNNNNSTSTSTSTTGNNQNLLRILIQSGSAELFANEIKNLVKNLKLISLQSEIESGSNGGSGRSKIELEWIEEKGETHVYFLFPHFISNASKRALENSGKFLKKGLLV